MEPVCIIRRDYQPFDNAFSNWRRDLTSGGDFEPPGTYPRRRSDEGSSEEGKTRYKLLYKYY